MGSFQTKECKDIQQGDTAEPSDANSSAVAVAELTQSLPNELSEKILQYLLPHELGQFSQVSVKCREICNSDRLWHHQCVVKGWERFGTSSSSILNEVPLYTRKTNVSRTSPLFELYVPEETRLLPVCKWKLVYLMVTHLNNNWRLGRYTVSPIMREHTDHLCCIASEGYTVCSGGNDKLLRMWDIRTCKCTRILRGHTDAITKIVLRGNEVITACRDSTVRVFDRESGKLTLTFQGHTGAVDFLCVVDHLVITAASDKSVRVWCLKEKRLLHTFREHDDEVESMAVHGRRLMTGSWDLTACMWDLESGRRLHRFRGHTETISVVEFDDTKAISGGADGDIRVWSLETGGCIRTMTPEEDPADVYCMVYNCEVIAAGYADSAVRVWSHEGKLLHILRDHLGVVRSVFINDQRLVSAGDQNKIVVWDYRAGKKLMELHRHPTKVQQMLVFDTRIVTVSPESPGTICIVSFW